MANFPNSVTAFSAKQDGIGQIIAASHVNTIQDEVAAIEDGYLNGTARLNAGNSTVATLSVAGGSTFAGTLAMGSTAVQIGSSAVPVQKVWASAIDVAGGSALMTLLKANSGTTTNAAAENVDTIAITGLTAKDTLVVYATLASVTQQTANAGILYNVTDSVTVTSGPTIASGVSSQLVHTVRQAQVGATTVLGGTVGATTAPASVNEVNARTFTTAWTGAWTLALRHAGVTAGGTLQWSWAVYKVPGQ